MRIVMVRRPVSSCVRYAADVPRGRTGSSSDHDPDPDGGVIPDDPGDTNGDTWVNHRWRWILDQLSAGVESHRGDVERQFKRSPGTAKRDQAELRDRGLTSFVRKPAPGEGQMGNVGQHVANADLVIRRHTAPPTT